MRSFISALARAGTAIHPLATVALVVLLNAQWSLTLLAFGPLFERTAGVPLLDLENTQGVLSGAEAQALVAQYDADATSLYWTFFVVDNVVPLLAFGSYALLWAFLLDRSGWRLGARLSRSWLILLPFGVGLFDIIENLFFLSAIATTNTETQLQLLTNGLVFVQLKAVCLIGTFAGTVLLAAYYVTGRIRRSRMRHAATPVVPA